LSHDHALSFQADEQPSKDKGSTMALQFLRSIELVSVIPSRIIDSIVRFYGVETPAQAVGRALSQGVNIDRLQKEIDELEAMADAIEISVVDLPPKP